MNPFHFILGFFFLVLLQSCCAKKTDSPLTIILKTTVYKNGKETLFLLKNKSLDTATVNGFLTYHLKDNSVSDVIKFSYEKDMDKVAVDGGLKEEVLFEIPKDTTELSLSDSDLQKIKMLFGRYCYCRGQNGIIKITEGNLQLTRKKEVFDITLTFHQKSIPQAFDKISSK